MAASVDTPLPLTDLQPESDLLHLLFHRNKNQHRSGKWWKWFGMLRRSIRKLLNPSEEDGDANKRVEYMRRVLVPSCYSAFTSVIADTQFAPLGLTLLAILARVHAIVGPEKKEAPVVEVKEVKAVVVETSYQKMETLMELADGEEDFGEAIVRGEEPVEEEEEEEDEEIVVEETVVVEEEEDPAAQEAVIREAPLVIRRPPVKLTVEPDTVVATIKFPRREEKTTTKKKKAVKPTVSSSLPPARMPPPPPVREERREKKSKRKTDEKEGAKKKKKRKKVDEIDNLFAGLL